MIKIILYIIMIILVVAGIVTILIKQSDNYKTDPNPDPNPEPNPETNPDSIKPTNFSVGVPEKPKVYKSSNLCDDTVLKPIIPVSVDYESQIPIDCPCTKYLEPP